jgi:hypothetical protein
VTILSPFAEPDYPETLAWAFVNSLIPWVVDLTLLLRVIAVYPPRTTSFMTLVLILAFPVACKIIRLAIIIRSKIAFYDDMVATKEIFGAALRALRGLWPKIEWALQMADDGCVGF